MNTRLVSLPEIRSQLWHQLEQAVQRGAAGRAHAWRQATLATVAADGAPEARTVVLREVDTAQQQVLIYTDARTAKVAQLRQRPQAVLVCWSAELGWQLRLRLQVAVETEGLSVTSRWARLRNTPAAHDYLAPLTPGSVLGEALPDAVTRDAAGPIAGAEHVRQYFTLLRCQVQAIDWLELHPAGHRRAVFDAQGERWVAP